MCLGRLGRLNPGIAHAQPLFGELENRLVPILVVLQVPGLASGKDIALALTLTLDNAIALPLGLPPDALEISPVS